MDNCILFGKTVNQPELKSTQEGTPIAEVLLAFYTENSPNKESLPFFVKVVASGKNSRQVQNLKQGSEVFVEGRLSTYIIERSEGLKEKKTQIIASRVLPLPSNQDATVN